jgi:hypothetical protein
VTKGGRYLAKVSGYLTKWPRDYAKSAASAAPLYALETEHKRIEKVRRPRAAARIAKGMPPPGSRDGFSAAVEIAGFAETAGRRKSCARFFRGTAKHG